jgi:hypothetical protein
VVQSRSGARLSPKTPQRGCVASKLFGEGTSGLHCDPASGPLLRTQHDFPAVEEDSQGTPAVDHVTHLNQQRRAAGLGITIVDQAGMKSIRLSPSRSQRKLKVPHRKLR